MTPCISHFLLHLSYAFAYHAPDLLNFPNRPLILIVPFSAYHTAFRLDELIHDKLFHSLSLRAIIDIQLYIFLVVEPIFLRGCIGRGG